MVRFTAVLLGVPLLLAPLAAAGQPVPDGLSVEWQGQKPCERLYEDAQILVARCTFPPGAVHVHHFHPGYFFHALSGGTGQVEDARGKRQVEIRAGASVNSPPVPWHQFTNVGDTTISYITVEKKYEPVTPADRASIR